jgi:hypothetical protein
MDNIQRVGWGLIHHQDEDPAVLEAIDALFQHRHKAINDKRLVQKFVYRAGDDATRWLERHQVPRGSVNPQKVPLYLLVVGSPARIPFAFTHALDLEYAVGRLHFATAQEYARYAQSVIDYETKSVGNRKEAVFFATRHPGDKPTESSADTLVKPLIGANGAGGVAAGHGFQTRQFWGEAATKAALQSVLASSSPPAFLLAAAHGAEWPKDDDLQRGAQGALVCQEWPLHMPLRPQDYFSAADVGDDAQLHGLVAFFFACFSAGAPVQGRYFDRKKIIFGDATRPQITGEPFIAALPQRLLAHPNGGALACIGHIDKVWSASFMTQEPRLEPFQHSLSAILSGLPVGMALMDFNDKFAAVSADLSGKLFEGDSELVSPKNVDAWLLRNDAEGYVLLGDPAVRLRVEELKQ